ncbi:hypothetical protein TRIATDRAFT_299619 [Trichoderma atroviride IMI 206040]|uniref:Uncharacterized protein n=1 Tax=Hypocrea atroviridis (strain ATCC 20476 / IMI 206040) TaxID=452589 RepID=G9NX86_HYPAI|nr:uncharacterized protein TRIATDRAFT_299619 [Trichoderma atroviride IMI 206040]EHK44697.1 hypothetical protein TRIATDRAFT_299619 [Trichoderma atroviride IMI 206040]
MAFILITCPFTKVSRHHSTVPSIPFMPSSCPRRNREPFSRLPVQHLMASSRQRHRNKSPLHCNQYPRPSHLNHQQR